MRVLLVKTSSMGDLIHTLPALTDAKKVIPDITFDWVVEEGFKTVPTWHPAVGKIIPLALRRWRKNLFDKNTYKECQSLRHVLNREQYDVILDAQGLFKSAILTFFAKGQRVGLNWRSAREPIASLAYQRKCEVNFYQHAVTRMRQLFSQALHYTMPDSPPNFGIDQTRFTASDPDGNYMLFFPGTTWKTKLWPEEYWIALAKLGEKAGFRIKISGGNAAELSRAARIAAACSAVDVLPDLTIANLPSLLLNAKAAIAVDTGFGHIAAAFDVPTVSLYGPTNPAYTGALGMHSVHLAASSPACAPCLARDCSFKGETPVFPACFVGITPELVWQAVLALKR